MRSTLRQRSESFWSNLQRIEHSWHRTVSGPTNPEGAFPPGAQRQLGGAREEQMCLVIKGKTLGAFATYLFLRPSSYLESFQLLVNGLLFSKCKVN